MPATNRRIHAMTTLPFEWASSCPNRVRRVSSGANSGRECAVILAGDRKGARVAVGGIYCAAGFGFCAGEAEHADVVRAGIETGEFLVVARPIQS